MKRRYDIGNGCMISDDGHVITADIKLSDSSSMSIGIARPDASPVPDVVRVTYSADERFYYLQDYTDPHGCWLSAKKWDSLEAMQAEAKPAFMDRESVLFTANGASYYRELLPFMYYSVKSLKADRVLDKSDDMVQDFLAIFQEKRREQEKRFNETIVKTGRTLKWIMQKIGDWIPFEPDPAPIVLGDSA